jgi:hypothetical protein
MRAAHAMPGVVTRSKRAQYRATLESRYVPRFLPFTNTSRLASSQIVFGVTLRSCAIRLAVMVSALSMPTSLSAPPNPCQRRVEQLGECAGGDGAVHGAANASVLN